MFCPKCGKETRVLETDKLGETVTRVRWCRNGCCRYLFETYEALLGEAQIKGKGSRVRQAARQISARTALAACPSAALEQKAVAAPKPGASSRTAATNG